MKKVVLVMIAALLVAAPAFSAVRNSKHDLSSSSTATIKSNNVNEVCVFCHTPHGGVTGILAPLWNRSTPASGGLVAGDLYNSATLDQNNSSAANVLTAVNNSDAPLCFSCHDGGSLAGGLQNNPASNGNQAPTFTASVSVVRSTANLGTDLKNDHPIGMDYGAVQTADTLGFEAEATANELVGTLPLYTSTGIMWCSTCHDVHNQGSGTPFLNMTNVGSALCTTCHIK